MAEFRLTDNRNPNRLHKMIYTSPKKVDDVDQGLEGGPELIFNHNQGRLPIY